MSSLETNTSYTSQRTSNLKAHITTGQLWGRVLFKESIDNGRIHTRIQPGIVSMTPPCLPSGSWLISITFLFFKISKDSFLIVRTSAEMYRGAAMIAHKLNCVFCCSIDNPLFPINNMSGSFQCPGPAAETSNESDCFDNEATQSVIDLIDQKASLISP